MVVLQLPKELSSSFSGGDEDPVGWPLCTVGLAVIWTRGAAG